MRVNRIWIVVSVLVLAVLACQLPGLSPAVPEAPDIPQPTPVEVNQAPAAPVSIDTAEQQDVLVGLYEQVMPGIVISKFPYPPVF